MISSFPSISIEDTNNVRQVIKRLPVSTGFKGLGIVSAPDGNWHDRGTYLLQEKIHPWNASITSTYLQRHDVYRSATTGIFKSIDYSLPVTFYEFQTMS